MPRRARLTAESLHRAYGPALYRLALRWRPGDRRGAERVVGQTIARALRTLRHPGVNADVAEVRPWLATVARRVALDHGRARARAATPPAPPVPLPLLDGLAGLAPEHQQVLIELYRHGRSVAEVADRLELPTAVVAARALAALRALR